MSAVDWDPGPLLYATIDGREYAPTTADEMAELLEAVRGK